MRATSEELATLLQMQQVDLEIIRLEKELAELPQRKVIVAAREKKRVIEEKRARVESMRKEAEAKLSHVSDEDAKLAVKQRIAQEAVENAKDNYRNVEARAKEMNGYAKRRATLEEELDKLGSELAKVEEIEAQVSSLLESVNRQEAEATEAFQTQGGALKNDIARLEAQKARVSEHLSEGIRGLYDKTASRTGGVAVARLLDGKCSACRTPIDGGRLLDLKAQAPLATCPNCKRLLIVVPAT